MASAVLCRAHPNSKGRNIVGDPALTEIGRVWSRLAPRTRFKIARKSRPTVRGHTLPVRADTCRTRASGLTARACATAVSSEKSTCGKRSILLMTIISGAKHVGILQRLILALGDRDEYDPGAVGEIVARG